MKVIENVLGSLLELCNDANNFTVDRLIVDNIKSKEMCRKRKEETEERKYKNV